MNRFAGLTLDDLDALSEMIAKRTIEHGIDRIITQEVLEERVRYYTEVAKVELEEAGPEDNPDSSAFTPTATIFTSDGWEAPNVRVGFRDGRKRATMFALSMTCKTMLAQAVILRIAATSANIPKVAKAMGLNCPDPFNRQKVNYFEDRMWKWIEKNYGRARLSALPPELRHDVIMVGGMGPKLKDVGIGTPYRWENGKLVFGEASGGDSTRMEVRMGMVPRWWQ